jgi:hypothetical protein
MLLSGVALCQNLVWQVLLQIPYQATGHGCSFVVGFWIQSVKMKEGEGMASGWAAESETAISLISL